MKKWFLGITSFILSIATVSAFGYVDFRSAANDIIQWIQDIFGPFLAIILGVDQFDQYLFARILLAILLFMVVYSVIKKVNVFREHETIARVVAIIVALLGARTLTESQFIIGILIPYGAVAIGLSVALPILIYFYFVHESGMGSGGRRMMWVLFGVIFVSLWISRLPETTGIMNWIYFGGIALTIIFFAFDGSIHKYFEYGKYKQIETAPLVKAYHDNLDELEKLQKRYGAPNDPGVPSAVRKEFLRRLDMNKSFKKQLGI